MQRYDQIKQDLSGGGPAANDFVYPAMGEGALLVGQRPGSPAFPPAHQMTAFPGGPSPGNFPAGWRPPSFKQP